MAKNGGDRFGNVLIYWIFEKEIAKKLQVCESVNKRICTVYICSYFWTYFKKERWRGQRNSFSKRLFVLGITVYLRFLQFFVHGTGLGLGLILTVYILCYIYNAGNLTVFALCIIFIILHSLLIAWVKLVYIGQTLLISLL